MTDIIAAADFESPLFWAVFVGWIISVILHEFAHGIVAHWGGDYTIKERGGLTLNPIQYVDPMFSIIVPAIILLIGGIPLPGGVTYIRTDLLRNKSWDVAVSLAGPAMNLLLCVACLVPLHPAVGWVDPSAAVSEWSNLQVFLGATALLQFLAMVFNLAPVPPLDGFRAISPFLPYEWRERATTYPLNFFLFFVYVMVLWNTAALLYVMMAFGVALSLLGFDVGGILSSYWLALFGEA